MSLKIVTGNLITMANNDGLFDVIVHGCNCFHTMGAGIALQVAKTFPNAFNADKETGYGDWMKLGSYSVGEQLGNSGSVIVINAYTQFKPGKNFNIDAFRTVLWKITRFDAPLRIGFPLIGGGIGGGDPREIIKCLKEFAETTDNEWTLVMYG